MIGRKSVPKFTADTLRGHKREESMRRCLVLYRLIHAGIEVVRVLHGSRDVAAMFNEHPAP